VLSKANLICCEDTRTTRSMLKRYHILEDPSARKRPSLKVDLMSPKGQQYRKTSRSSLPEEERAKLLSFHKHSHPDKIQGILDSLRAKQVVAIVSDSGTHLPSSLVVPSQCL